MPCIVCYDCFVFTVSSPPLSPVDPIVVADYTAAAYDYVIDDSTPTVELPSKQCPFPSPTYRLFVFNLSFALGIAVVTCLPIKLHSLSLSPLDYLSIILCSLYINIIHQLALRFASQLGIDSGS